MRPEKTLLFNLIIVALLVIVSAISPQLSVFNDGNFDKTLYTNKTSNVSISIAKNVTIIHASFNVTEVDLGIVNYEQIYNFYTLSVRNGTDEAIAAGTRGYVALVNTSNGLIINAVYSSTSSYITDSDFRADGLEALLVSENGEVLVYNASAKTITKKQGSSAYLTGVSYSPDGSYAIGSGDWGDPIFYYNTSSGAVSNLSIYQESIETHIDINPNSSKREALMVGRFTQYSKGITKYNISCGLANLNTNNWATCTGSDLSNIQVQWRAVSFNPNGSEALVVGDEGKAVLYNASDDSVTNLTTRTNNSLRYISYAPDGTKAVITGLGGVALVYNSSCKPTLCNLSSGETINLNSVRFIDNNKSVIAGSGRTILAYNLSNNQFTNLRNGTSGILYHVASRPTTDEALIVADEGQAYKYNFTTKGLTSLSTGTTFSLSSVSFNWNGSEALAVGDGGIILRYNPSNSTFTTLLSGLTESLLDVSYKNGTNNALISGYNRMLLSYNSTCDGVTASLCQITNTLPSDFPTNFPIFSVSFNPNGSIALLGGWGRMMIYYTNGTIRMIKRSSAIYDDVAWPNKIAWKPNGTEALIVGNGNATCDSQGLLGAIALYNSTSENVSTIYCFLNHYLKDAAYSSNGTEALIVGAGGDLVKYNPAVANDTDLSGSVTTLASGTTGTLWGVDYRRDNVTNEAILVVGDDNQVLFYDGEKVMTSPEVFLGTARIWNFTGNYNTTTMINFTSNLTAYLQTCSADSNGECSVPFYVNATTQTSIMRFHDINITYNHPPILLSSIPNQSWNQDTSATINLTQYFNDSDRDTLTYGNTAVTSITITISQGIATLSPDSGFYGTRYIIFNATDSINLTNSNNITLTINQVISPSGSSGSSGGGGGGAATCTPRWICTGWGFCINNTETRECIDINKCSTKTKPA
ncbi:hypothetical protein HYT26_04490, partial [Candidatus Pacearchaeota archaeon]|nr:hypothetical protein [Candidatus Pacearchaeota archaeon]